MPLAPAFHAIALGLEADPASRVDVSVTGEATLFEVDLPDGPVPLRRARATARSGADGLFGRGWRSELESRVVAVGDGALVVRVQGVTPFVPLEGDVLVSLAGEVELLRRLPDGWELAAADGRAFTFDAQGELTSLAPGFRVERAAGRIVLAADDGARVLLELDASGRLRRAHAQDGEVAYAHDPRTGDLLAAGERRYAIEATGRLERAGGLALQHDPDGRVARLATDDGRTQTYTFAPGRAAVGTPSGRYEYEQVDDGWRIRTPRGEDRAWLDARGRLVALRRAGEETRGVERDDLERPLVTDAAAGAVDDRAARALGLEVTRDAAGRLTGVLTPVGRRWSFAWDDARLVSSDGPAGPVTFERDARGAVVSRRDASGRAWFHERDEHGRPRSVATAAGEQIAWTRDEAGVVTAIEAHGASGEVTRLELRPGADGASLGVRSPAGPTLVYRRDPGGDTLLSPWGRFVTTHDEEGRAVAMETPAGAFRFAHDAEGRRVATGYPNGVVVERDRDEVGRVARQVARHQGHELSRLESAWDERGDRARTVRDGMVTRYAHDARGRLARLERGGRVSAWSWNEDADRVAETIDGVARESRFDARGRLVSRDGADRRERFVHDGAGRLTERVVEAHDGQLVGRDRFAYDGFGRLARVERAGQPAVEYRYDPLGRLLSRTVGGATTRYVHDGERLLAEVGPGARERVYVWGPGDDEPLAWCERAGAEAPWRWRFVVSSDLHTSLVHVDEEGRVVAADDLDPWGAGEVGADHPVFFAGRLIDAAAGLVHMRARWYDPSLGRFLTPDPAGLAGGPNAYVYVSGRPLDLVDPLGLQEAPREEPGALTRFGRWLGDKAAATRDTVVGATEGLAYLTGLRGTADERAAARAASWSDVASGRAVSRGYGAFDAYVQGVTLGLVDPTTSRFAFDPEQARRGRATGAVAGAAFGLVSGRAALGQALRAGAGAVVQGARAFPGAVRALPGALRAAPGAAGRGVAAIGRGVAAAPGAVVGAVRATPRVAGDGFAWLAANRGDLARAIGRVVAEQAAGAYRVTVGPFVSLGRALLRPFRSSRGVAGARGVAQGGLGPSSAGASTLLDDALALARAGGDDVGRAGGGASTLLDDAAKTGGADDLVTHGAPAGPQAASDGIVRALGDESAGVARGPGSAGARRPFRRGDVPGSAPTSASPPPPVAPPPPPRRSPPTPPAPVRPARLEVELTRLGAAAFDPRTGRTVGEGTLLGDGLLTLYVNVPAAGLARGQGYGREAIVAIHEALVASGRPVRGIEACWLNADEIADNLRAFEAGLAEGLSVEQAALATSTGRAAQALGYGRVAPGSYAPIHEADGSLASVALTFVE